MHYVELVGALHSILKRFGALHLKLTHPTLSKSARIDRVDIVPRVELLNGVVRWELVQKTNHAPHRHLMGNPWRKVSNELVADVLQVLGDRASVVVLS